jgi:hypothetical protein
MRAMQGLPGVSRPLSIWSGVQAFERFERPLAYGDGDDQHLRAQQLLSPPALGAARGGGGGVVIAAASTQCGARGG